MPMYNVIEYSNNYSNTSGSLWQHCKNIPAANNNGEIVNFAVNNLTDSFNGIKNVEIMVPLKYSSI